MTKPIGRWCAENRFQNFSISLEWQKYIYIFFLQVWEKSVGRRRQALAPDTIRDAHLHSLALPETPSGLVGWLIGGPWAESYVEVEGLLSSHEADFIYLQRVDNL